MVLVARVYLTTITKLNAVQVSALTVSLFPRRNLPQRILALHGWWPCLFVMTILTNMTFCFLDGVMLMLLVAML